METSNEQRVSDWLNISHTVRIYVVVPRCVLPYIDCFRRNCPPRRKKPPRPRPAMSLPLGRPSSPKPQFLLIFQVAFVPFCNVSRITPWYVYFCLPERGFIRETFFSAKANSLNSFIRNILISISKQCETIRTSRIEAKNFIIPQSENGKNVISTLILTKTKSQSLDKTLYSSKRNET